MLLKHNADPSLKLTNGVGSALCSATTFTAERRRQPNDRLKLVSMNCFHNLAIIVKLKSIQDKTCDLKVCLHISILVSA